MVESGGRTQDIKGEGVRVGGCRCHLYASVLSWCRPAISQRSMVTEWPRVARCIFSHTLILWKAKPCTRFILETWSSTREHFACVFWAYTSHYCGIQLLLIFIKIMLLFTPAAIFELFYSGLFSRSNEQFSSRSNRKKSGTFQSNVLSHVNESSQYLKFQI